MYYAHQKLKSMNCAPKLCFLRFIDTKNISQKLGVNWSYSGLARVTREILSSGRQVKFSHVTEMKKERNELYTTFKEKKNKASLQLNGMLVMWEIQQTIPNGVIMPAFLYDSKASFFTRINWLECSYHSKISATKLTRLLG